jgi:hypothetical protein
VIVSQSCPISTSLLIPKSQDYSRVRIEWVLLGVQIRGLGGQGYKSSTNTRLYADLIVDASGQHSKALQWLAELGYEIPRIETINSNIRYASRSYVKPEQFPAKWQNLIINGRPPNDPWCSNPFS